MRIGGGVTHAEVAASKEIEAVCPTFCELANLIGDPAVRHKGTIGGVVANFDPAADYPAALLALGGTIHTDRREIGADDFFLLGLFETALEEDEIVTASRFEANRMRRAGRSSATPPRATPCAASSSPGAATRPASP